MEWWRTRYLLSGWVFAGTAVLLSRGLPGLTALLEHKPECIVGIIGLSGPPLGYIVYSLFFLFHHLRGGTGRFVDHERLRSGATRLYRQILDRSAGTPTLLGKAKRALEILEEGGLKGGLNEPRAFKKWSLYTVVWHSFAPENLRNGCHRRWELFHTSGGILTGLVVAVALSWGASECCGSPDFLGRNAALLLAVAAVAVLMWRTMRMAAYQAANRENLWIELFLKELEDRPDLLFQVV
jgi:hypothetical protein